MTAFRTAQLTTYTRIYHLLCYTYSMIRTDDCWHFAGHINSNGYGIVFSQGKRFYAHRLMLGNPSVKLQVDHLCRNRRCINPNHLELVSRRVNIIRGISPAGLNARKTHCLNGHKFTKENTLLSKDGRRCRTCNNRRMRDRYNRSYTRV